MSEPQRETTKRMRWEDWREGLAVECIRPTGELVLGWHYEVQKVHGGCFDTLLSVNRTKAQEYPAAHGYSCSRFRVVEPA